MKSCARQSRGVPGSRVSWTSANVANGVDRNFSTTQIRETFTRAQLFWRPAADHRSSVFARWTLYRRVRKARAVFCVLEYMCHLCTPEKEDSRIFLTGKKRDSFVAWRNSLSSTAVTIKYDKSPEKWKLKLRLSRYHVLIITQIHR